MGISDKQWMELAYQQALKAKNQDEVPVGAVIVSAENKLLAQAANRVRQDNDACAHAEILAIRLACQLQNNFRLTGSSLYVTLEPCAMCAGAIMQARLGRLIFATRDFKTGAAGSIINLFHCPLANPLIQIDEGLLQKECANLLSDFFQTKRP